MSMRKFAMISAAVGAVRRYARKNPEKTRGHLDKVAGFADSRTKGKYSRQITSARDKASDAALGRPEGGQGTVGADPQRP